MTDKIRPFSASKVRLIPPDDESTKNAQDYDDTDSDSNHLAQDRSTGSPEPKISRTPLWIREEFVNLSDEFKSDLKPTDSPFFAAFEVFFASPVSQETLKKFREKGVSASRSSSTTTPEKTKYSKTKVHNEQT